MVAVFNIEMRNKDTNDDSIQRRRQTNRWGETLVVEGRGRHSLKGKSESLWSLGRRMQFDIRVSL
jgi:hypothetical protein